MLQKPPLQKPEDSPTPKKKEELFPSFPLIIYYTSIQTNTRLKLASSFSLYIYMP